MEITGEDEVTLVKHIQNQNLDSNTLCELGQVAVSSASIFSSVESRNYSLTVWLDDLR
jgi:hypothetical protein